MEMQAHEFILEEKCIHALIREQLDKRSSKPLECTRRIHRAKNTRLNKWRVLKLIKHYLQLLFQKCTEIKIYTQNALQVKT